jgi:hypothetical protein
VAVDAFTNNSGNPKSWARGKSRALFILCE